MSKLLMTLLLALAIITPALAQDDAENLCFENGGFLNAETGQCDVHITLEITTNYPVEYIDMPFVMEQLDTVYDTEIQNFIESFSDGAGTYPTFGGWALDMDYSSAQYSDTILSVIISEYMYTGGAHGISFQYAFTFDTEAETVLTLDDIFTDVDAGLAVVAPLAVTQINETLGEFADSDWIADGTSPDNPENYGVWYLSTDGINFYFGSYQVAPYAAGPQTVVIPWTDVADVLEPAFVPAS